MNATQEPSASKPYKVFISYSWTTPAHEEWVLNLATRLISDGVNVVIDKWDLKLGQDKYSFMESMVHSEDIDKVLMILDKKYTERANERSGGVGTETQIISPQIYDDVSKNKFIPIARELDDKDEAYTPTFLKGRIYIDFSDDSKFEVSYEKLLRDIYKRPLTSKPALGSAPKYLFEETPFTSKTSILLRGIDHIVDNHPKRFNRAIQEFLNEFVSNLQDFKIKYEVRDEYHVGKAIYETVSQYMPMRDDFINYIDKVVKSELSMNIDDITKFFEEIHKLTQSDSSSYYPVDYDHYKFIVHELFICTIAVLLKNERYDLIEELLYAKYYIREDNSYVFEKGNTYGEFYGYIDVIKRYYEEIDPRRANPMAAFMIRRITNSLTKELMVEADAICYYVSIINGFTWFPILYLYKNRDRFEIFKRLDSKRHFEKVKKIFNVDTVSEFIGQLSEEKAKGENGLTYSEAMVHIPPLHMLIDKDKVAIHR